MQDIQVVLEIQDLLLAPVATLGPGHASQRLIPTPRLKHST
jgi:hypothetical protein